HDLLKASAGHVLVVDIGGGSTELSLVRSGQAKSAVGFRALLSSKLIDVWGSLPLGVVTLYDSFASQPEDKAFAAMRVHARQVVGDWAHSQRVREAMASGGHIIGTSGTVTCLAGVHLNLAKYRRSDVDGVWMDRQEAGDAIKRLVDLGHAGRAKLPTIGQDRAKLMLSGCAILEAIWEVFGAERMQVADRGLREGLLLTMMYGPRRKSRRRRAGKQERAEGGGKARDGRG
ncbi:MAG: Ppx/GppA family phosphatase, partial [Pseudomonadota bacterium]